MIADKAGAAANDLTRNAFSRARRSRWMMLAKANLQMHALLYGLIKLLMDDVMGQPAENEQQVRINVLDAPAPERVGIPAFIDIG